MSMQKIININWDKLSSDFLLGTLLNQQPLSANNLKMIEEILVARGVIIITETPLIATPRLKLYGKELD